ncbi:MAG: FKBP-type peptidyl-prolyl cis-trans isomerase [bacterium]
MKKVKKGDTIKISYVGTFDDGSTFDETEPNEPFEFNVGSDEVIEGLDKAVVGMEVGEKKEIHVSCDEAYGEHDETLVLSVPKDSAPEGVELEEGNVYTFPLENGETIDMELIEINDDEYIFDGNHELAGQNLNFSIELLEIV